MSKYSCDSNQFIALNAPINNQHQGEKTRMKQMEEEKRQMFIFSMEMIKIMRRKIVVENLIYPIAILPRFTFFHSQ